MKILINLVLVIFVILSCSKISKPTAASGTLSKDQTQKIADGSLFTDGVTIDSSLATVIGSAFGSSSSTTNLALRHLSQFFGLNKELHPLTGSTRSEAACEPTTSGNTADADGDGVPVDVTYKVDCSGSNPEVSGSSYSIKVEANAKDKDDTKKLPLGGMSGELKECKVEIKGAKDTLKGEASGKVDLTQDGKTYTLSEEFSTEVSLGGTNIEAGLWVDATVTADSESSPENSGKATFTAYIMLNGLSDFKVTLKATATDATYAKDCDTGIKDGTVTLEDGSSNTILLTFASCKLTSKTYNGEAL